ncbi:MAG: hypothetical protein KKG93_15080, partial [Bacteroidetes bacterium]|nr:hypothetical protein [Bacteroidota bacterium]
MLDFVSKQYLWIIGIIISLFAIFQTWRLNKINSRKRNISLFYKIKSNVSLDVIPEKITINYQGESFTKICFAEFILGNNGYINLLKNDIIDSIKITSDNPIKILSYKIIDHSANDNDFQLSLDNSSITDFLELNFKQIYVNDSIKFYVLFVPSNSKTNFELNFNYNNVSMVDSKKVTDVSYYDNPYYRGPDHSWLGLLMIAIYLAVIYFSFLYTQKYLEILLQNSLNFSQYSSEIISFFVAVLPPIL